MRNQKYVCSRCGRGEDDGIGRDKLAVKKVMFVTMGAGSKTIKSRVTEWLCPRCIVSDPDWNRKSGEIPVYAGQDSGAQTGT